jgi:hypothetical protein
MLSPLFCRLVESAISVMTADFCGQRRWTHLACNDLLLVCWRYAENSINRAVVMRLLLWRQGLRGRVSADQPLRYRPLLSEQHIYCNSIKLLVVHTFSHRSSDESVLLFRWLQISLDVCQIARSLPVAWAKIQPAVILYQVPYTLKFSQSWALWWARFQPLCISEAHSHLMIRGANARNNLIHDSVDLHAKRITNRLGLCFLFPWCRTESMQ